MTKKKATLLCVGILWFSATAIASSAQEVEDTADLAFSYLIDKYNLELVAEVPSGVSPIVVDTPENLEHLLKELTTTISVETNLSSSESSHDDAVVYPFGVNQIMRTCNVDAGLIA